MADEYSDKELEETAKKLGISPKLLRSKSAVSTNGDYSDEDLNKTAKELGINFTIKDNSEVLPPPTAKITVRPGGPHFSTAEGIGDQLTQLPIIGPVMDNAVAAGGALTQPLAGEKAPDSFIGRYNQNRQDLTAARSEFEEENPKTAIASNLAGNVAGGGLLAATKYGRAILGLEGPSLGAKSVLGGIGQGIIGGTDAALKGDNIIPSTLEGTAGGFAGPIVGTGLQHGLSGLVNMFTPPKGALKGASPIVINKLLGGLEGETPQTIEEARKRIGPAGMLGDLTQGMTDIAGGLADVPGANKQIVRGAYQTRADLQRDRIKQILTSTMGPERNIPEEIDKITQNAKKIYDPLYEKFHSMAIFPTPELKALIPRLEKAGAFGLAEELSGITGKPINTKHFTSGITKDFPTAENWDYVKRGLDRRINQAYKTEGGGELGRALVGLKNEMLDEIKNTPAGKIWEQARNKFAEKSSLIEQVAAGEDTFLGGRSALTKDELAIELRGLSNPEKLARQMGLRAAVDRALGDTANGDTTLRNKLLAPNNQEKIKLIIGDAKLADNLIASLKQEHAIGLKTADVLGNVNTGASASSRSARRDSLMPEPARSDWDLTKPMTYIPPSIRDQFTIAGISNAMKGEKYSKARNQLADYVVMPNDANLKDFLEALKNRGKQKAIYDQNLDLVGKGLTGAITGPGTAEARKYLPVQK